MPDGTTMIVCGRGRSRRICDICDRPAPKRTPKLLFINGMEIDLCDACMAKREEGDPEWRRFAEKAISRNLGLAV